MTPSIQVCCSSVGDKCKKRCGNGGLLANFFYHYGRLVATYPYPIILLPIFLTIAMAPGFNKMKVELRTFRLFLPPDSVFQRETDKYNRFVGAAHHTPQKIYQNGSDNGPAEPKVSSNDHHNALLTRANRLHVYVKGSQEDQNLLTPEILTYLENLTSTLNSYSQTYGNRVLSYNRDLCNCDGNNKVNGWLTLARALFESESLRLNPNFKLTYPIIDILGQKRPVGEVLQGVELNEKKIIESAKVICLYFPLRYLKADGEVVDFARRFQSWIKGLLNDAHYTNHHDLQFFLHYENALDREFLLIVGATWPYLIMTIVLLVVFVVCSNLSTKASKSKSVESLFAVASVVMALICSFGLLFYLEQTINPVAVVAPFLILSIGVHDAFLILAAWRVTNDYLTVPERMATALRECGVSLVVTSVTDFLCFGIGYYFSLTPAIASFCLFTSVSVAMDFLFQITFFVGVVALGGRSEARGAPNCLCCCRRRSNRITTGVAAVSSVLEKPPLALTSNGKIDSFANGEIPHWMAIALSEPAGRTSGGNAMQRWFRDGFAPIVSNTAFKLFSGVAFAFYVAMSLYGCATIRTDVGPTKLLTDDSSSSHYLDVVDRYMWSDNLKPSVTVLRPPDFTNKTNIDRINNLAKQLESIEYHSVGPLSTKLFVRQYQQYLGYFKLGGVEDFYDDFYDNNRMAPFLNSPAFEDYKEDIKFKAKTGANETTIKYFRFSTSYYNVSTWEQRKDLMEEIRRICRDPEFADLDSWPFHFVSLFSDQRDSLAPSFLQTLGFALGFMGLVSLLIFDQKMSAVYLLFGLLSVCSGVLGGLSVWNCDLDFVSLGCVVLAIGLAIDFTAHVCYAYAHSPCTTPERRLADVMETVAWPITQAGLATVLGVTPLAFVPAYMVRVFFKTALLVVLFGLLHGLVWLPQLQMLFDRRAPQRRPHDTRPFGWRLRNRLQTLSSTERTPDANGTTKR